MPARLATPISPRRTAGFTLVELIVAISVIAIMSAAVLVNYRSAQRHSDVHRHAYLFAGSIREAQNRALGSYENSSGVVPAGGWGIRVDTASTYVLFADNNGDHALTDGEAVRITTVPSSVTFAAASVGATFVFEPPDPTVYLNGVTTGAVTVTMTEAGNAANSRTITANAVGLVDVN